MGSKYLSSPPAYDLRTELDERKVASLEKAGKPKIIVAGGGIGGLTAALSLIKRGFEGEIYEQAPILREGGAGVPISANGMLGFRELRLSARLMEEAADPERRESPHG